MYVVSEAKLIYHPLVNILFLDSAIITRKLTGFPIAYEVTRTKISILLKPAR